MNVRPPRLLLGAAMLVMIAGAIATWLKVEPPLDRWDIMSIAWCPGGLLFFWALAEWGAKRRAKIIAEKQLTVLPSHLGYNRLVLLLFVVILLIGEAIVVAQAYHAIGSDMRDLVSRGFLVVLATVLIVLGDRRAKLTSPYRGATPEPPNWERNKRIAGWGMVITGLVLIPCAILLPTGPLVYGTLVYFIAVWLLLLALRVAKRAV